MAFEITVKIPVDFDKKTKAAIIKAHDDAIMQTTIRALGTLRPSIPVKSGLMQTQARARYLRVRNRLLWSVIRVIGSRSHVMHILEYGAKTHGGTGTKGKRLTPGGFGDRGPLEARHTFERAYNLMQQEIVDVYNNVFSRSFLAK